MKRQVFYSFHYDNDAFRVQQIRNMGIADGNEPVSANDWETVKKAGNASIEKWIDDNMKYKNCLIVLVGEHTSNRPWVRYEITKAWQDGKALLGIYIHNLKCAKKIKDNPWSDGKSSQGVNPFTTFTVGALETPLSNIVRCYNPDPYDAYNSIRINIENWVEEAIRIRNSYR